MLSNSSLSCQFFELAVVHLSPLPFETLSVVTPFAFIPPPYDFLGFTKTLSNTVPLLTPPTSRSSPRKATGNDFRCEEREVGGVSSGMDTMALFHQPNGFSAT